MVRKFSIRDFANLPRIRESGHYLNSSRTLLWGKSVISIGALSAPISNAVGVFTAITPCEDNLPCIGQAIHTAGSQFAYFTYLTPNDSRSKINTLEIIQNLTQQAGQRGAFCMISEVDEDSEAFEVFRFAKYSIFSHQQVWQLNQKFDAGNGNVQWRETTSEDEINIRKLYNAIVPAIVQKVEPPPWTSKKGFLLYQNNELMAFVEITSGPNGIWIQPYFHPDLDNQSKHLTHLFGLLNSKKPKYICVRAYQSWLNYRLKELHATKISNQVLMGKHLTVNFKTTPLPLQTINNTEPTTPYSNSIE